jgi:solute carrier family 12 sodium/potassium/chloride transporter 2
MEINKTQKKFGTFAGVFTPDVLTILGVILYLRLGWVVGNTGFLGALFIILMAKTITITTGLSMSSITTNIKIGAGGAYSIISKSLGLEAGGSVGIPFYISQTLSAALYIVGFTEGWLRIFPSHNYYLIAILTWMVVLTISYISANVAIKTQYFIMMIIALSLASFVLGETPETSQLTLVGNLEDVSFWGAFAIFFPAVTGIMAGANLSGELKNPKIAIPRGTMAAIAITLVIYVALAYLFSSRISAEVLRSNQMAMIDYALWAPAVIMGILAATFSSALGSTVGAPRILQALAAFKSVPFHRVFCSKERKWGTGKCDNFYRSYLTYCHYPRQPGCPGYTHHHVFSNHLWHPQCRCADPAKHENHQLSTLFSHPEIYPVDWHCELRRGYVFNQSHFWHCGHRGDYSHLFYFGA